jgi:glycosyltransferase involved in cell wall biosynthesis
MKAIVLVTNDVIGDSCAGPGIRYIELGRIMARKGHSVTLLGKKPSFSSPQTFSYGPLTIGNLIRFSRGCDCLIFRGGGPVTTLLALLFYHGKDRIADLYAFTHFEVPHLAPSSFLERYVVEVRKAFHMVKLGLYSKYLRKFMVSSERQRDFLCGVLFATDNLGEDRDISVIPFGYPSAPPRKVRTVLRGVVKGIEEDDFILIWGGGVWDWLDPITLVRAMSRVAAVNGKIKLYFMGLRAPSGYVPEKGKELLRLSRDLGLLNKNIFVNEGWIPYDDRTDYLLEADAGVSLHPLSLETHFSFRTRNLDYVYCGLPMIHTKGDVWADMIERNRLGFVVSPGDDREVAEKIIRLCDNRSLLAGMKKNINTFSHGFTWEAIGEEALRTIDKNMASERRSLFFPVRDITVKYLIFGLRSLLLFFRTLLRPR